MSDEIRVRWNTALEQCKIGVTDLLRNCHDYLDTLKSLKKYGPGLSIGCVLAIVLANYLTQGQFSLLLGIVAAVIGVLGVLSGIMVAIMLIVFVGGWFDGREANSSLARPMTMRLYSEIERHNRVVNALVKAEMAHNCLDQERYDEFKARIKPVLAILQHNRRTLVTLSGKYNELAQVPADIDQQVSAALNAHGLVDTQPVAQHFQSSIESTAGNLRAAVDLYGSELLDLTSGEPRKLFAVKS